MTSCRVAILFLVGATRLDLQGCFVMSKSSPSILNHFKRKGDENEAESFPKRQKAAEAISAPKSIAKSLTGDFKFNILPPDFNLEWSNIPGREIKKKPDLDLVLFKPFLSKPCAKLLYKYLLASLPWYKVFLVGVQTSHLR
jgi:hypothetical protein